MNIRTRGVAKRLILSLAAGAAMSGCVYAPPYAAYDSAPYSPYYYPTAYPYGYGYPTYVGPPISLSLGYSYHRYSGGRGWGGHGGWRGRH
jgi:hypothetical protein